ncbi:hypothetical protein IV102_06105 [bacterium]|nr:hypothetical protein [bacterium]
MKSNLLWLAGLVVAIALATFLTGKAPPRDIPVPKHLNAFYSRLYLEHYRQTGYAPTDYLPFSAVRGTLLVTSGPASWGKRCYILWTERLQTVGRTSKWGAARPSLASLGATGVDPNMARDIERETWTLFEPK